MILFAVCVTVLAGCKTNSTRVECPVPSFDQIESVSRIVESGEYEETVVWIAELERFCQAVDKM